MTETKKFKMKKPDITDPVDVSVFNDNFDILDEELGKNGGSSLCEINLFDIVTIDFSDASPKSIDVTSAVTSDIADILLNNILLHNIFPFIRVRKSGANLAGYVLLNSIYEMPDSEFLRMLYTGVTAVGYSDDWSEFTLDVEWSSLESYKATLTYCLHRQAEEKPIHLDLSGYYDGVIRRFYADEEESDIINVTFDENGNPIKFSNGTEEFAVTWPVEDE